MPSKPLFYYVHSVLTVGSNKTYCLTQRLDYQNCFCPLVYLLKVKMGFLGHVFAKKGVI